MPVIMIWGVRSPLGTTRGVLLSQAAPPVGPPVAPPRAATVEKIVILISHLLQFPFVVILDLESFVVGHLELEIVIKIHAFLLLELFDHSCQRVRIFK